MSDRAGLLTPAQQAQWVAKIHSLDYQEPVLSSDLLGPGLWIAYAGLALFWFRGVAPRRTLRWLMTTCKSIGATVLARYRARSLEIAKEVARPRAQIFPEPAAQI
jgi:hypothetical protein